MANKNINKYIVTNPDGKEYAIDDLNKFCKEHDLWPSNQGIRKKLNVLVLKGLWFIITQ